jgi:sulfopyruvate decarboxylase subunit beta
LRIKRLTPRVWQALVDCEVDKVAYLPCNKLNALMAQVPDSVEVLDITRASVGLGQCFGRSLA